MDNETMLEEIADIFDVDVEEITAETSLDDLEWDSMAMLGVMALAKAHGNSVSGETIRGMRTVADIMAVL